MTLTTPTFSSCSYVVDLNAFDGVPITLAIGNLVTCTRDMSDSKDRNLTLSEYVAHPSNQHRQITFMDDDEFDKYLASYHQRAYFDKPPEQITEARFIEYLGVMPALRQGTKMGMFYFLMSEPLTGTIVRMCGQYKGIHLTSWVDYRTPATWLTTESFRDVGGIS